MFKFLKNKKFRIFLFIFSSLLALFIFFAFYLILEIRNSEIGMEENEDYNYDDYYGNGRMVQKVPDLGDILTGPIISSLDPVKGKMEAPISIVEFSDFECEFCGNQEKIIESILVKYKDQVKLIWKDYPINDENAISYKAAVAARCAQDQDKFWDYHDKIFREENLAEDSFLRVAEELGLNTGRFEDCLESSEAKKLVDDNIEEANALDINGVPFIYVNDQEVMGEINLDELEKLVEIELSRK